MIYWRCNLCACLSLRCTIWSSSGRLEEVPLRLPLHAYVMLRVSKQLMWLLLLGIVCWSQINVSHRERRQDDGQVVTHKRVYSMSNVCRLYIHSHTNSLAYGSATRISKNGCKTLNEITPLLPTDRFRSNKSKILRLCHTTIVWLLCIF